MVSLPAAVTIPSESGKLSDDNQKAVTGNEAGATTAHRDCWYQQQTENVFYLWEIDFSHSPSGDKMPCFVKQVVMVDLLQGSWRVWVNGMSVSPSSCAVLEKAPEKVAEPNLDILLKKIDESKKCPGITKRELVDYANSVKTLSKLVDRNYGQTTVRHVHCEQLMVHGKQTRCKHCNTLRIRLTVQLLRFKGRNGGGTQLSSNGACTSRHCLLHRTMHCAQPVL